MGAGTEGIASDGGNNELVGKGKLLLDKPDGLLRHPSFDLQISLVAQTACETTYQQEQATNQNVRDLPLSPKVQQPCLQLVLEKRSQTPYDFIEIIGVAVEVVFESLVSTLNERCCLLPKMFVVINVGGHKVLAIVSQHLTVSVQGPSRSDRVSPDFDEDGLEYARQGRQEVV